MDRISVERVAHTVESRYGIRLEMRMTVDGEKSYLFRSKNQAVTIAMADRDGRTLIKADLYTFDEKGKYVCQHKDCKNFTELFRLCEEIPALKPQDERVSLF